LCGVGWVNVPRCKRPRIHQMVDARNPLAVAWTLG
jgi:hypothetical protein